MRYDAKQIDSLAAEYVLGTMQSPARQRFESVIAERGDVRVAVWRWERHLNGLMVGLEPQRPPRRIWKKIRSRINPVSPARTDARNWWRHFGMALPTAIALAWIAIVLLPAPGVDRMAVFSDQNAAALWIVSADLDNKILQTTSVNAQAAAGNTSYELWVLPAEGPPQSLGLLRIASAAIEIPISDQLADALEHAGSLAISLEPAGGSPTGLPTGPIVYQASLVSI